MEDYQAFMRTALAAEVLARRTRSPDAVRRTASPPATRRSTSPCGSAPD
jgi:hypothetical protein